jgi:PD-(D/E)XK nuclease superfamily
MSHERFYFLTRPTEWVAPPKIFSFSSLKQIAECPFKWQLQNSKYEGLDRYPSRPNPAAVEGGIIHSLLEKLFRALACYGMPLIGSETFQKCISEIDINLAISRLIRDYEERIALNPRGHGFQLRYSIQQLRNKVVQIFRDQYDKIRKNTPPSIIRSSYNTLKKQSFNDVTGNNFAVILNKNKVITELTLEHKELPFSGIIDFIWFDDEGIKISDFKSGAYKHDHKDQVLMYALLLKSNVGFQFI